MTIVTLMGPPLVGKTPLLRAIAVTFGGTLQEGTPADEGSAVASSFLSHVRADFGHGEQVVQTLAGTPRDLHEWTALIAESTGLVAFLDPAPARAAESRDHLGHLLRFLPDGCSGIVILGNTERVGREAAWRFRDAVLAGTPLEEWPCFAHRANTPDEWRARALLAISPSKVIARAVSLHYR